MSDGAAVLRHLQALVELESPSGDVPGVTALADVIQAELAAAGVAVGRLEAPGFGVHLEATVPGSEPAQPLLVLGHMDTVFPAGTLMTRPFRVEGSRATGPGVYDMKAGLAVLLEVAASWARDGSGPRRPLHILLTCDEEVGSHTSRPHILRLAHDAVAALVLEPSLPGGAAKTARKGVGDYIVRARGQAAHAGEPEKGVNAIAELAKQLLAIEGVGAPHLGTTVTPGLIAGGTASNVVPAEAWVEVDVRFATVAEAERIDAAMRGLLPVLPGATLALEGGISRLPLERTEAVVSLYLQARSIAQDLGFELGEGSAGGASDGNLTAAAGLPTLDGLGPDGGGAHAVHEFVLVDDLPRRVALLRGLLETL